MYNGVAVASGLAVGVAEELPLPEVIVNGPVATVYGEASSVATIEVAPTLASLGIEVCTFKFPEPSATAVLVTDSPD